MYDHDQDSNDLCLIDSGLKSLQQVPLRPHLQGLNLHSNYIQTIENLGHLKALKHLDLSSNQISIIEGLEGLYCLRTVNLSCNFLADVRGLAGLRSLTRLNLSYNQIQDISGFRSLAGPEFKLSHIDLHGNKITSSQHVIDCLSGCVNLRQLVLKQEESSNPVCSQLGYRKAILEGLPQLQYLDNISRSGQPSSGEEVLADIPGLEDYMDYLMSNGNSASSREGNIVDIITPKIDKAIEQFKQRAVLTSTDTINTTESEPSPQISRTRHSVETEQDKRIKILEQQLAELMHANQETRNSTDSDRVEQRKSSRSPASRKLVAKRDVDQTDESDDPAMAAHGVETKQHKGKKSRKSRLPSYCKSTAASRARKDNSALSSGPEESSSTSQADLKKHSDHPLPGPLPESRQPSAYCVEDTRLRQDVQSTYVQLMKELENERERRWKSEQATKKLAEHIKDMHTKVRDGDQLKDVAVEATSRLKQALTNERESKLRLQDDLERMQDLLKETSRQLSVAKETEESLKTSLRNMEEVVSKMERDKLQQLTHEQKKSHDSQMKASALGREVEMLRHTTEKQKGQLQQLQELLANREQQHREEMKKCFAPNSRELNDFIQRETTKAEKQYQAELKGQQEKVDQLTRQYSELEDEFRIALQIEATRFKELQDVFQRVSDENSQNKQALSAAQRKDEKASEMLSELTALVKEQKGRISELSKSKQEQNADYRERVQTLESHVEEARKRMLQMELLKQDKTKLLAQVEAQESVISGLKAERKLWGQELAQQGASLAQDRGRLEAKIETQMSEISSLKKQLDREADALKIKTKMLEDQTETIRKLKEGLLERDEEIKHAREEALKLQRNLEEQLAEERAVTQDNQETLERLRERKQDLKQQVSELQAELDDSKKAHSILNNKWKEKSQLIGQLEKQVQEMKECWEGKEHKIADERDKAVHAANIAIEKLRSVDDAFRKQLDAKEQKHQEEITLLVQEKQEEIDQAYQRVHAVEQEMRVLLKENEASKKAMEDKVKRLTRAMSDLQTDFL